MIIGCSQKLIKPNQIAVNVGCGENTFIKDFSQTENGESYETSTLSVEYIEDNEKFSKALEFNITKHHYYYINEHNNNDIRSFTVKGWLIKNFRFEPVDLFAGIGIGAGYMNPGRNNAYIDDTNLKLVSDLGFRFGLSKKFKEFIIRLEYQFRHFSAIWRDDKGENEDEVRVGVIFPFDLF